MTTSGNGKSLALVILIVILLLFAFRSIFFILPFGVFPGLAHSLRDAGHSLWRFPGFFPLAILPVLFMLLWIFVIVWVFRDAESRGMNGLLWALLVLVGNVIGLIIYLIIRNEAIGRPKAPPTEKCPACGNAVGSGFAYCPNCGAALKPVCPGCRKPVDRNWKVCPDCGTGLDAGKSEPK